MLTARLTAGLLAIGRWAWWITLALALFLAISGAAPAIAQEHQARAVLVLAPGMSAQALFEELAAARWEQLRKETAAALVSSAVPGPDTPESGYLTIGSGRRRQFVSKQDVGILDATAVLSPQTDPRVASLLGLMRTSRPFQRDPSDAISHWLVDSRLVLIVLPPGETPSQVLEYTSRIVARLDTHRDLLILSSADPDAAPGGQFGRLAPALFWGSGWSGGSAVSATTRTAGLISNTDLAPTLIAHFGQSFLDYSGAEIEGHVVQPAPGSVAQLLALERHTRAIGILTIPVLIGWGVFAFFGVAFGLFLARGRPSPKQVLVARGLVAAAVSVPVAMLLAGWVLAASEAQLVGTVVALTVLVAGLVLLLRSLVTPLRGVFALLVGGVMLDLFTGGRLLSRCLLGDFVNTGVRFYGIGNEYEGLVLGAATLAPFMADRETNALRPHQVAWVLWPMVLLMVASPRLGADFGGALSLGLAFAAGLWLPARRRFHVRQVVIGLLFLALLAVGVVALDLARPEGSRSHVGELAAQALSGNFGRVEEVVGRKLLMNLRMTVTPYALAGLAAVAALGAFCYHMLAFRLKAALASRPLLRAGSGAALLGAAAAFLLNDSGIVAGALAAGCVLVVWLDMMLVDAAAAAEPTNSPA